MSIQEKSAYQFFTSTARLVLYLVLALGIFFAAAFFVFMLRGSSSEEFKMPDLVGKYYIDVHNDLSRMELRTVIHKKRYPDRPAGMILSQSVAPGASVALREKVYIVVNQPEAILTMPELVGSPAETARARLSSMPAEDDVYSIAIGAISYVPASGVPAGTVLAQFPAAGQTISPMEKAFLLVSELGKTDGKPEAKPGQNTMGDLTGQNIAIASQMFARRGIEYRIRKVSSPASYADSGIITGFEQSGSVYLLDVNYKTPGDRYRNGLEKISVELDEPGVCKGEVQQSGRQDVFFVTQDRKEEEENEIPLFFYREGEAVVRIVCGDSTVYKKSFEPEA